MLTAFMYYLAGALTLRLFQILLSMNPNYYIFKQTEFTVLTILADLYIQKLSALKVLELSYRDSDREAEFDNIKNVLEQRYDGLIASTLSNMKARLPYKTNYKTLEDAMRYYLEKQKERKDV